MRQLLILLPCLLLVLGLCGCKGGKAAASRDPDIAELDMNNKATIDAVAQARGTVQVFMDACRKAKRSEWDTIPEETSYEFRIMLGEEDVIAHVWVRVDLTEPINNERLNGRVIAVPASWRGWRPGQPILQDPKLVFDWRIVTKGKVVAGDYTTKAMRSGGTTTQPTVP